MDQETQRTHKMSPNCRNIRERTVWDKSVAVQPLNGEAKQVSDSRRLKDDIADT